MRLARVLAVAAMVIGVAACGSSGTDAKAPSTTTTKPAATTSTSSTPLAGRPTQWRDDSAHWKELAPDPFDAGPTAVADQLAARYRGGDTSSVGQVSVAEVRTGEPLVVVLREQGISDGILDRTIEITLEPGDQGWKVVSARVQDGCVEVNESDPTHCV